MQRRLESGKTVFKIRFEVLRGRHGGMSRYSVQFIIGSVPTVRIVIENAHLRISVSAVGPFSGVHAGRSSALQGIGLSSAIREHKVSFF